MSNRIESIQPILNNIRIDRLVLKIDQFRKLFDNYYFCIRIDLFRISFEIYRSMYLSNIV